MAFRPIHEWFGDVAARQPMAPAIERAGSRVTYAELDRRAWRIANALLDGGMPRGAMVMVLADDTVEMIASIVGVLRAGGVFVPVDPRLPNRRVDAMAAEVDARWFMTDAAQAGRAHSVANGRSDSHVLMSGGGNADSPSTRAERSLTASPGPRIVRDADDPCYVYFTSGSTGQPKGILAGMKGLDHYIAWEIDTLGLDASVRVSQLISPSFDPFLRDVFTPLCAGGTVCVPDSTDLKLDARRLVDWIDRERITLVHCVPSLFRMLLDEQPTADRFTSLRHVLLSGEPLLPIDVKRWMDVFGTRIQLVNLYGPTETTMTKLFHVVRAEDQHRPSIPIGVPMRGAAAIVLDASGRPRPRGMVGEIYLRTPYRSLGYFGRPELTSEVFVQNPLSDRPGDIVYRTGDLGRVLPDGTFEFRGRRDQQVKIRGERVELAAVENALRAQPQVRDVAVIDRRDSNDTTYLCAYLVSPSTLDAAALRDQLARALPPVMVPTAYVQIDALPRTATGKLDRHRLPAPSAAPVHRGASEPPASPTEARLASLFAEVLGIARVGVRDNFFELGGHSLLATRVVARVRREFSVDLPVRSLFESPTVGGLARHVDVLQWALRGAAAKSAGNVHEVEV